MIDKHQKRAFLNGLAFALANMDHYCRDWHCTRRFFRDTCEALFLPEPEADWMCREFNRLLALGGFDQELRRDN